MIDDIRFQVITGVFKAKSGFGLDKSVGKVSYVFSHISTNHPWSNCKLLGDHGGYTDRDILV